LDARRFCATVERIIALMTSGPLRLIMDTG
jgi:hypothetical protein